MDIVTHAGIGVIAAAPFMADRPELGLGLVAGSVLPDLDAFYRLIDKRSFLQAHQTWSHALPIQLLVSIGAGFCAHFGGGNGLALAAGLFAGLAGHTLLDLTNTFGVALFKPLTNRRFCVEWVFFIDAIMLLATAIALGFVVPGLLRGEPVQAWRRAAYFSFIAAYVISKGALRRRAAKLLPEAQSLVPSALVPWQFFHAQTRQDAVVVQRLNVLTGTTVAVGQVPVLDAPFLEVLQGLPEFRLMREVSPEYHVVSTTTEGNSTHLLCRDMRTRNFGTRFGDLEVWLDADHKVTRSVFHV